MTARQLNDLEFFAGVVRAGTLTAAARDWDVSVPVVSRRLKALEQRLGALLVHRSTRELRLTPEGELYRDRAQAILADIADLENSVSDQGAELVGGISVRATAGIGRLHIAPLLAEFRVQHPGVSLRLDLSSEPIQTGLGGHDLGIRVGAPPDSRLAARLLARSQRVVCASPGYAAAVGLPQRVADLAAHECLTIRDNDAPSTWRLTEDGRDVAQAVSGPLSSTDGEVVTAWCLAGHGLMMRSLWHAASYLRTGALVQALGHCGTPEAHVFAVYEPGLRAPRRVRALIEFLEAELPRRLTLTVPHTTDEED